MMRFPRWLSWIVLIGLGWILFVGNTRDSSIAPTPATKQAPASAIEPVRYEKIEALFNGERWMKAIRPDYQSPKDACRMEPPAEGKLGGYAIIETAGTGEGLQCGDVAALRIARRSADGSAGKATEVTLTLGEQSGFDGLLLGMRSGERRLLIANLPEKLKALPTLPANTQLLVDVTRLSARIGKNTAE